MNATVSGAHPPWPHRLLDIAEAKRAGHRGAPFRQFVLKVHSRCNLACDYCYVYEMADQGWQHQPRVMSTAVVRAAVARIAEHVRDHNVQTVKIVLHGGEPLLAGTAFIEDVTRLIRQELPVTTRANLSVQTNGTRLDRPTLEILARHGIQVGVSLDGGAAATDRHRHYPSGRGSYRAVARALALLSEPPYREIYGGLLCTVSLENDPVETYEALLGFHPPLIDFLLPHGTWSAPPPGRLPDSSTPYADWLWRVFQRWTTPPGQPARETSIRLFEGIVALLLGEPSTTEVIGLAPADVIVIDTDGAVKQVDALYASYDGAADTGLTIVENALDEALENPTTVARQMGRLALGPMCQECRIRDVCGGGYYPHRYRAGEGFQNPSVFCPDLLALITAIRDHVARAAMRSVR